MGNLDAEISVVLRIYNPYSAETIVQVEVPYLDKYIEVRVPNNIQTGHRIRLKEMGYSDKYGNKGDLYIVVSDILMGACKETNTVDNHDKKGKKVIQKMLVVEENNFYEVNSYLGGGWIVKDFKPFKRDVFMYVYVLLEKTDD